MGVGRSYRFAWRPRWFAGHLLVLAAAVVMVFLGRWQLDVSNHHHFRLQNFGYALQWWAFSGFAVVFWIKIVVDQANGRPLAARLEASAAPAPASQPPEGAPAPAAPVAYRRYVMPTSDDADRDPELARYNAYLASLADRDLGAAADGTPR